MARAQIPLSLRRAVRAAGSPVAGAIYLTMAVYGFHWDITWHAQLGRDGLIAPPHLLIIAGSGLGFLRFAVLDFTRRPQPASVTFGPGTLATGGVFLILFVDNWWHELFGIDVTVSSPAHLGLIAALWLAGIIVAREATEDHKVPPLASICCAISWSSTALVLMEYRLGFPPYSMIVDPIVTALTWGLIAGCLSRQSERRFQATELGIAILLIESGFFLLNQSLGLYGLMPSIAIVPAGLLHDLVVRRHDTLAKIASAVVCVAVTAAARSAFDRVGWHSTITVVGITLAPLATLLAARATRRLSPFTRPTPLSTRSQVAVTVALLGFLVMTAVPVASPRDARVEVASWRRTQHLVELSFEERSGKVGDWVSMVSLDRSKGVRWEGSLHWNGAAFVGSIRANAPERIGFWLEADGTHFGGIVSRDGRFAEFREQVFKPNSSPLPEHLLVSLVLLLAIACLVVKVVDGHCRVGLRVPTAPVGPTPVGSSLAELWGAQ